MQTKGEAICMINKILILDFKEHPFEEVKNSNILNQILFVLGKSRCAHILLHQNY